MLFRVKWWLLLGLLKCWYISQQQPYSGPLCPSKSNTTWLKGPSCLKRILSTYIWQICFTALIIEIYSVDSIMQPSKQHSYINIANLIPMIPAYNHLSCWYLTVESMLWVEELHRLLMSGKQNLQTFWKLVTSSCCYHIE